MIEEDLSLKGYMTELLFYMFNGKVAYIFIIQERNTSNHRECVVDENWNYLDLKSRGSKDFVPYVFYSKPQNYNELNTIAIKLAEDFDFVRVDFMLVNKQIFISELTLYPHAGFRVMSNHQEQNIDEIFGLNFIINHFLES